MTCVSCLELNYFLNPVGKKDCLVCSSYCRDPDGRQPGESGYTTCFVETGDCRACDSKFFGPSCQPCSSGCDTCADTPLGDGHCYTCVEDKFGANCDHDCPPGCPGQCHNDPTAVDSIAGDGLCDACPPDHATSDCSVLCPSGCDSTTTGECDDGLNGLGNCIRCPPGVWGSNCENPCTCDLEHGVCTDGYVCTFLFFIIIC